MDVKRADRRFVYEALHAVPTQHAAAWLAEFAVEHDLTDLQRDALWMAICPLPVGASRRCLKDSDGQAGMDCYCNTCVPGDDIVWTSEVPDMSVPDVVRFLMVYPRYDYMPLDDTKPEDEKMEAIVHAMFVHAAIFPKPLDKDMLTKHRSIMGGSDDDVNCTGVVVPGKVESCVRAVARMAKTLVIVFCGHGAENGNFVVSNGKPVKQEHVAAWLKAAGFKGTVICVFNCCHAADTEPRDNASMDGWNGDLPFKWVHIYSCGPRDTEKGSHAAHVMRTLRKLMDDKPCYSVLETAVSDAWKATRDPAQGWDRWRPSPFFKMGGAYSGEFGRSAT